MTGSTYPFEATAQQAWERTLTDLIARGTPFGAERPGVEILGYTVGVENVRARGAAHPRRSLSIVSAVARFVWMMAGSDRLADIAFYEPKVARFTDDQLAVPGSNYGARLRQAAPGLDQVAEAIKRLAVDPEQPDGHLRRAANVIWRPEDAARKSNDIPCAFGLGYFPRSNVLHTELVMRSNNAMLLLPFNLFEFTLLAEVVAVGAGLQPGRFTVHAMSMHLYEGTQEREVAEEVIKEPGARVPLPMPAMPADDPLGQINALARAEASLRHNQREVAHATVADLRLRATELNDYWSAFFDVLLVHSLVVVHRHDDARGVAEQLPDWARLGAVAHITRAVADSAPAATEGQLFDPSEAADLSVYEKIRAGLVDDDQEARAHIDALLDAIEAQRGTRFGHSDASRIVKTLLSDEVQVAARSDGAGSFQDYRRITEADVLQAIHDLGL
jgi:thymidylate synthase